MSSSYEKPESLIIAINNGDTEAWIYLVNEYQGRLLRFAQSKIKQKADAEDLVQDTFIAFLRSVSNFRLEASLETYLYLILRNKIYDHHRYQNVRNFCLVQDVYHVNDNGDLIGATTIAPSEDLSASRCLGQEEHFQHQRDVLTKVLKKIVKGYKTSLNFRDLQLSELLFFGHISGKDTAKLMRISPVTVRTFKHRLLGKIQKLVAQEYESLPEAFICPDSLLTEIWASTRLSCPKYSTIGAFLLERLESQWFEYVDFHLTTLGCQFCRANYKDLQRQQSQEQHTLFQKEILASTIGFLTARPK